MSQLEDYNEIVDWDDIDTNDHEEAHDIVTPPVGRYGLEVPMARIQPDTKRISILFSLAEVVSLRNEEDEDKVSLGDRVMMTIFPPNAGEKNSQGVAIVMTMCKKIFGLQFGVDIKMPDFLTMLEQTYKPGEGNKIYVTIGQRAGRDGNMYPRFQNDWSTAL